MKTQTTVKPTQEENNRLINEFMGKQNQSYPLLHHLNISNYNSSWDSLMPVIEKISKLNLPDPDNCSEDWQPFPRTFGMTNDDNGYFMFRFNRYGIHEAPKLIDAAYSAVVELLSGLKLRQKGGSGE